MRNKFALQNTYPKFMIIIFIIIHCFLMFIVFFFFNLIVAH